MTTPLKWTGIEGRYADATVPYRWVINVDRDTWTPGKAWAWRVFTWDINLHEFGEADSMEEAKLAVERFVGSRS